MAALDRTLSRFRIQTSLSTSGQISPPDRKSTRLNSSHGYISYAVFCLKKKNKKKTNINTQPFLCYIAAFFFNDPTTHEIYTLSLHDALPICDTIPNPDIYPTTTDYCVVTVTDSNGCFRQDTVKIQNPNFTVNLGPDITTRSEEHTSELQSRLHLVCRLLLEKKKQKKN